MTVPIIRIAKPDDSEDMRKCILHAFAKIRCTIPEFPDVTFGLEDSIAAGLAFAAEKDGRICGALTFHCADTYLKIEVVAVDAAFRGLGIGRLLMEHATDEALRRGVTELRLRTHILMPENVALYQYLGWQVISTDETGVNMALGVAKNDE